MGRQRMRDGRHGVAGNRRVDLIATIAATLLAAPLLAPAAEPAKPLALHPDNPHYFLWRGRPTILITSGEHYGAVLNLDFDYVRYFDELHSRGLNLTRTFSGVYREIPSSFNITDNTLAPHANRYLCPWARSSEPGYYDGGGKFDLTKWDAAYFQRLEDLMSQAQARGIVVELNLFCPMYNDDLWKACPMNAANNVNGVGRVPREEVYTLKHPDLLGVQLALVREIVGRLREFDNLYYEVSNEPYFGGVTMEWQHKIVDAIVEAEKDFSARHLISMNIANGRQKVDEPHPAVSIFNFHYCVPPDTVAMNCGLNKVIGENETGFRGKEDVLYRTEGWDFLIAGGGLYNNLDYSFTANHPGGTFLEYASPGGGSPALREQLSILKKFLGSFDFIGTEPDSTVIRKVEPELSASALVRRGEAYAVYLHVPLPQKPKDLGNNLRTAVEASVTLDLPAGEYQVEWVNTKTGAVDKIEALEHRGGDRALVSPPFDSDVALRITSR